MAVSASRISFICRLRMSIAARRARSWPIVIRRILLFGLNTILPSRPAYGLRCRAQTPSRLPKAPEGLGLYGGEHGGILTYGGIHQCNIHISKVANLR